MIEEKSLSDRGSYTIEVVTDYNIGKVGGHTVWRKEEDIKDFIKEDRKLEWKFWNDVLDKKVSDFWIEKMLRKLHKKKDKIVGKELL